MKKTVQKPELDPRAVRILKKVRKAILEEPEAYDQGDLGPMRNGVHPTCGSPACIIGWAIFFRFKEKENAPDGYPDDQLYMTPQQVDRLFHKLDWPLKFREEFNAVRHDQVKEAKVAAKRIQHFIKTDGRE